MPTDPGAPLADNSLVTVEFDVPAQMRDGTTLRANVYRPAAPGPWPTLLTRTPYDKDDFAHQVWAGVNPVQTARAGFMVVIQDVRGRFASAGEWEPYRWEAVDGYDSVEWAARLPGSNGRVGMYSASYGGNVQWLAAAERPPSLAAISPALTWYDPCDGLLERGGALELGVTLRWTLENGHDAVRRRQPVGTARREAVDALVDDWDHLAETGYWDLPVGDLPVLRRHALPDLGAIAALTNPRVRKWSDVVSRRAAVSVPSLHTAGWYDIFLQGTLDNFTAMAKAGHDAQLVVGPWTHTTFSDPIGGLTFGARAARAGGQISDEGDWADLQRAWFRRHLDQSADAPDLAQTPVRRFVMGRNEWRSEATWPPSRARPEAWYLTGAGGLAPRSDPVGPEVSSFVFDPGDPVPTLGGNGVLSPAFPSGPWDQQAIERRPDVLVFSSGPLDQDLEVTGRVRVVLHAQSSAESTDWVARLCDVHPDGRSFNVCDGIRRVGRGAREPRRYEIDLWSTSIVFRAGHRLRLQVTSSSFPRWDRNLGTGNQAVRRWVVAHQEIFHGVGGMSYVELPVCR